MSERWRSEFIFSHSSNQLTTPENLNALFRDGQYWLRAELGGEFEQRLIYSESPRADSDFEPGTLSQMIIYHIGDEFHARVHQMLLPGEERTSAGLPRLGGYGEPDCKELIEDGVWYYLRPHPVPKRIRQRAYLEE